jgi:hypothetical protein
MTEGIKEIIRAKARSRAVELTLHAQQEMAEENISPAELLNALENCVLLED